MNLKELREEISNREQEAALAKTANHPASMRVTGNKKPWTVKAGTHALARIVQRHGQKDREDWWQDFHRKVVRGVEAAPKRNGMHVVFSKSHGHGVVVHVDHDKREMRIHTMLDHGQRHVKEGDAKVFAEAIEID